MLENLLPGIELANGDCAAMLPGLPPADLILTSPPYDGMREFGGYNDAFAFAPVAAACVANLVPGGVLVWVIDDQIVDGGETGTRFRQALGFKSSGLTLHQSLVYERWTLSAMSKTAYFRTHADMYVFAKGKPKTANLLNDKPNIWANQQVISGGREGMAISPSGWGRLSICVSPSIPAAVASGGMKV